MFDTLAAAAGPVYMFPGQGSQTPDMEERVRRWAPELADRAETILGRSIFGSADTRVLQPAIYCGSIAGYRRATIRFGTEKPAAIVGHSLGEVAALAAAGVFSAEAGLDLVIARGESMYAGAQQNPGGGMMAVLGCKVDLVSAVADRLCITVATDNAPGEMVLAGRGAALATAAAEIMDAGGKAVTLPIEGAFHSPEMNSVRAVFESSVRAAVTDHPRCPVYSSHTTRPFDDIADGLGASLVGSVRWRETLLHLNERGYEDFVDCGPGHVLSKLVRRNLARPALALDDLDDDELISDSTLDTHKVGARS